MNGKPKAKELSPLVCCPHVRISSLPFAPPPKWASELSRKLQEQFPDVHRKHHVLYMRSFIHPSFTTADAIGATMRASLPLGESLLLSVGGRLIANTFHGLKHSEMQALLSFILSDACLSSILRCSWGMGDMVLTDVSVQLFNEKALRSTRGMLSWLTASGQRQIPDPYCAGAVKSLIGAVYLDGGLPAATLFIHKHVLEVLE
ncbi:hypothetical protein ERJ75_000319300 [Trypanosoma vivax]|nr:hypothetical protein ERJ75_000319300 [Trypanosoma vivax]